MPNRLPPHRRDGGPDGKDQPPQGNTIPEQGHTQERAPRMPHERDESADSQAAGEPSARRMAEAGRKDIERGLVDTDKGPVLDKTYEELRKDTPEPDKKFRR
jgi:hypothetical protein